MEILTFWAVLLLGLVGGIPVAFALAVASFALIFIFAGGLPLEAILVIMAQRMFAGTDSFAILALPLFFVAGALMEAGGISDRLLKLASQIVGWIRGGLAMVVVVAEMFFAGITGSSSADAAAIGRIMIPSLRRRGYSTRFAAALVAAGGAVGPIIPPSIGLVVYGSLADVSIAQLFVGGVVPGIMISVSLMGVCYVTAVRRGYPKEAPPTAIGILKAAFEAIVPLAGPGIILGGIFSGVFTATESAMVAVVYAVIVSKYVYHTLSWADIVRISYESALTSSRVMFIIATASFVGWVLAREHVPQTVSAWMLGLSSDPYVVLALINVIVLVFGCFLEGLAILIILLPTLLPVIHELGIDPVFFGVMLVMNIAIGTVTPPVGTCLVVSAAIANLPFERVLKEILPFLGVMIAVLFLMIAFPQVILWLPEAVFD